MSVHGLAPCEKLCADTTRMTQVVVLNSLRVDELNDIEHHTAKAASG